jgi:hypothetical protein
MRASLRHALAALRDAGLRVERIEHGRHTEIYIEGGSILRIHRGSRVSRAFERGLRSSIRKWSA